MDYKTALDHANSYHSKMVKPFEKLAEVLETAVRAEAGAAEADARRAKALKELEEFQKALEKEKTAGVKDVQAARQANEATANQIRDESRKRQNEHAAAMRALDEALASKQREHDAALASLKRELEVVEGSTTAKIKDLTERLTKAQTAYDQFLKKAGVGV